MLMALFLQNKCEFPPSPLPNKKRKCLDWETGPTCKLKSLTLDSLLDLVYNLRPLATFQKHSKITSQTVR